MNDLLYCYPDSDVLKNKLGIINQEKLHEVERKLTAIRINDLIRNLKTNVKSVYAIVTKASEETIDDLREELEKTNVEFAGFIPFDPQVFEFDAKGKPLYDLPADSPVVKASYEIFDKIKLTFMNNFLFFLKPALPNNFFYCSSHFLLS